MEIYTDKEQLISDTLLMFNNALAYYPKNSDFYIISEDFVQFLEKMKNTLPEKMTEDICMSYEGNKIRREYPEYYKIISDPIDLTIIGNNISQFKYKTIKLFIDDMACLISNARFFNNASSQIYQDTFEIEEFISNHLGLRISEEINKKLKYQKILSSADSPFCRITKLISHTLQASVLFSQINIRDLTTIN
ncbi:hypothetical protein HZS_5820 [Henneguya salminicola]|nr:hypothetical protein HZS_5820 [Henneguya salminicola]